MSEPQSVDARPPGSRLDALELQAMDAEVAQAALDAVVIRHGEDIAGLRRAIEALVRRLDALASQGDHDDQGGQGGVSDPSGTAGGATDGADVSLSEVLERERPPHY